jgi:hypothetical protein
LRIAAVSGALLALAAVTSPVSVPAGAQPVPVPPTAQLGGASQAPSGVPTQRSEVPLTDGSLSEVFERNGATQAAGTVVVEVLSGRPTAEVEAAIASVGGSPRSNVPGWLVLAEVPVASLPALEAHEAVDTVREPLEVNAPTELVGADAVQAGPILGEHVAKTNADAWHAAGHTGEGVKVGVIDVFDQAAWNSALAAGEVPAASGTFCRHNGAACDLFTGGSPHGVAVTEIVHDLAPDADIYLGYATSTTDLQQVVNYFDSQGVSIITRSLTARYDGAGNGTGPMAAVVSDAVSKGMIWFNSAGNSAGSVSPARLGSYWRGPWVDADDDGYLEFAPGDELLGFNCHFINGVRWSDWGANRTDYDVEVYDATGTNLVFSSVNDQTAGADPLEHFSCQNGQVNQLAITLWAPGSGTAGDILEFMTNGAGIEHWQNPHSVTGPVADSASPGMVTVGAVGDNPMGTTLAPYSSQGPTNDSRLKPDLSAAACMLSHSYDPCFNGTSSSTPVAAGVAALVQGAGEASTPAATKTYLLDNTVDRGAVGPDQGFGVGELILDDPPAQATTGLLRVTTNPAVPASIIVDGTVRDSWGLNWAEFDPGSYQVCFGPMSRYTAPPCQQVNVVAGETTTVVGNYQRRGNLRVITSPAVPSTITIDGEPANDWGVWTDLDPGTYQVCFGAVANFTAPSCQNAVVTSGGNTVVTGNFTSSPGAPGPSAHGLLRVTTSPATGARILVNGNVADMWGLTWLKLPAGTHQVCFEGVEGSTAPGCQNVNITNGATTSVSGTYQRHGELRVLTSPAVPATISVDGEPANAWGVWSSLPPGTYQVCYGAVAGYTTPACTSATVTAGALTTRTGTYTASP